MPSENLLSIPSAQVRQWNGQHAGETPHVQSRRRPCCIVVFFWVWALGSTFSILCVTVSFVMSLGEASSERSGTTLRQCKVLSAKAPEDDCLSGRRRRGPCCSAQVDVKIIGQDVTATAMQFRSRGASETRDCAEARGLAAGFVVGGGPYPCYQFVDGAGEVKLDAGIPSFACIGSLIFRTVLLFGFLLFFTLVFCILWAALAQDCSERCSGGNGDDESESNSEQEDEELQ